MLLIDNDDYLVKLISIQHKKVHRSIEYLNVQSFIQIDPTRLVMVIKNYTAHDNGHPSHSVVIWNIMGPTSSDQIISSAPLPDTLVSVSNLTQKPGDKGIAYLIGQSHTTHIYKVSIGFKEVILAKESEIQIDLKNIVAIGSEASVVPDILFGTWTSAS